MSTEPDGEQPHAYDELRPGETTGHEVELRPGSVVERPADVVDLIGGVRRVVGAAFRSTTAVAGWSERQTLTLLRERMEALAPAEEPRWPATVPVELLGSKMRRLLERSLEANSLDALDEVYHWIVDQLLPDEARIVAALSDGGSSPMVHVLARSRGGVASEPLLSHMSLIGKTANLTLPQLTPVYVRHLLALNVVQSGPEDPALKAEYEILAADLVVMRAVRRGSRGPIPPKVERASLRLSPLGRDLWSAAIGVREKP